MNPECGAGCALPIDVTPAGGDLASNVATLLLVALTLAAIGFTIVHTLRRRRRVFK